MLGRKRLGTSHLSVVLLLTTLTVFRLYIEGYSYVCTTALGMLFHLTAICIAEGTVAQYVLLVIIEACSLGFIAEFLLKRRVVWLVLVVFASIALSVPFPGAKSVPPYTIADCFCW